MKNGKILVFWHETEGESGKGLNHSIEYMKTLKKEKLIDWISDIKFNKDSTKCAIGSHNQRIYVYSVPPGHSKKDLKHKWKKLYAPLKGHSSYITHLDWTENGDYLHTNDGAYEILFWNAHNGLRDPSGATNTRDAKWLTWTSIIGFPV